MNSIAIKIFVSFKKMPKGYKRLISKKNIKSDNSNVVMSKNIMIFSYKGPLVLLEKIHEEFKNHRKLEK